MSLAVAVLAAFLAYRQVTQAKIANSLPVVLGLLGEFTDTRSERYFVTHGLSEHDPSLGVWRLPEEAREQVLKVLHYLDHLGLLVDQGLANEKTIAGFIGGAIIRLWEALEPYIRAERDTRGRSWTVDDAAYQEYFENLAARMAELDLADIRSHLRSFPSFPPDDYWTDEPD